jgi:ribonuclease HI
LEALHNNPLQYLKKQGSQKHRPDGNQGAGKPINKSISVDAACSGNPGILEYRGVHTATGQEIFHRGPFPEGTTNIGEFLAIVTGLVWLRQNNLNIPLYSDSYNGILWVKQRKVNTRLERTPKNEELFLIVEKALDWLQNNPYENQVLKWQTSSWGEIPADFGRK